MAVNPAEAAQRALENQLANLPREGVDRNTIETIVTKVTGVGKETRPVRKSGRTLGKEAIDQTSSRISRFQRGTQIDRNDVEEL